MFPTIMSLAHINNIIMQCSDDTYSLAAKYYYYVNSRL